MLFQIHHQHYIQIVLTQGFYLLFCGLTPHCAGTSPRGILEQVIKFFFVLVIIFFKINLGERILDEAIRCKLRDIRQSVGRSSKDFEVLHVGFADFGFGHGLPQQVIVLNEGECTSS